MKLVVALMVIKIRISYLNNNALITEVSFVTSYNKGQCKAFVQFGLEKEMNGRIDTAITFTQMVDIVF